MILYTVSLDYLINILKNFRQNLIIILIKFNYLYFHLFSNDLTKLKIVTSTDRKCLWSAPRDSCLKQYDAKPLSEHSCFKIKNDHLELDKNVKKLIKEKLYSSHLKSSVSEHAYGRE